MSTINMHSVKIAIGAVLGASMSVAVAQAPAAAENCASCHNDNGVSTDANIPTIAGVGSFFLENQFAIFAEGARPCAADAFGDDEAADHCALVSDLSEDDRMALAEYYGEMSFEPFEQEVDAGWPSRAPRSMPQAATVAIPIPARNRSTMPVSWPVSRFLI